jgi:lactose/L-arabinose transport system permease protein
MLTAPVAIASLVGLYKVEYGMIMAGATLSIIPVIILFLLGQKYFIAGILSGAIKG